MASKSLGTLTLDLVAKVGGFTAGMDKAERSSEKWRKQVEKNAKAAGAAVGAASAVAAGAMAVWVKSSINQAAELHNLAQAANTSTTEFQKFAAGARTVGIENDKLSDILKDVNDRVGDFLSTGGGPMKDFFEQVAPKVGVTAEQFKNLSGPQALGLYVDTLQKAGANQQEMTFFMEAMSSESTSLIPLLKDNGRAMGELGAEAESLGLILSEDTIKAAKQFNDDLDLLGRVAGSVGQSVAADLLPELGKLTDTLRDPATIQAATAMAKGVTSAFTSIIDGARDTVGFIRWAAESAAAFMNGIAADDVVRLNDEIARLQKMKESGALDKLVFFGRDGIVSYYNEQELDAEIAKLQAAVQSAMSRSSITLPAEPGSGQSTGLGAGLGIDLKATEKTKAAEKELGKQRREGEKAAAEALKEQARIQQNYLGLVASLRTEDEQRLATMREQLAVLDAMKGIPDAERAGVAGRIAGAATSDAPEFAGLAPEVGGAFGELAKIDEAEERLAEWYATQIAQLETFRQERADLAATWDAEELALKQEHEDELAKIEQARQSAQLAAAESVFADLSGMAATFAGEQSGLYKTMFAVQKAASIAQSMVAIQTGIAMAAANPFPANLAAMASVAAATASIVGNIGAIGMAHDGMDSIPKTGSWILEKGERVTTAETSAKLDKTLSDIQSGSTGGVTVNLNEDASRAGSTQMRNLDGKQILDVFVSNIRADGQASKAIASAFGVRRAGR